VSLSRYLDGTKKGVDPVLRRNAFFAHPENVLLAMLTDNREEFRTLAWRRIKEARTRKVPGAKVRIFEVPPLNLDAEDYVDLIQWEELDITEPPLISTFTDEQVEEFISTGKKLEDPSILDIPCHTQAVERSVQLVAESASSTCEYEARDRYVRVRLRSRKLIPKFGDKKNYKTAPEKD